MHRGGLICRCDLNIERFGSREGRIGPFNHRVTAFSRFTSGQYPNSNLILMTIVFKKIHLLVNCLPYKGSMGTNSRSLFVRHPQQ